MATLGEELKAAREAKGYTLRQIAEKTRISHMFLKALEEDDYEVIPGDIFVTGFLRTYAKELGLNEKEMLAKYREIFPKPEEPQPLELDTSQHQPRKPSLIRIRRGEKRARKIPFYAIVAAGLALGALLTALSLLLTPKVPTPPPKTVAAPQPAPFKRATTAFKQATSTSRRVTTTLQENQPQAVGQLALKLTGMDRSWYSYKVDKGRRVSGILEKGQTLSVAAQDEILLDLGNAGGVQVEFDGKVLGPFGPSGGAVKNILFTRDKPGVVLPDRSGRISNVMHGNDPAQMMNR